MRRERSKNKRFRGRGSFTVETALLMPLVLLVLFVTLYLCFFIFQRAWYTAAAYESAVSAGTYGVRNLTEARHMADAKARERQGNGGYLSGRAESRVSVDGDGVKVTYQGRIAGAFIKGTWGFTGSGEAKMIRPVNFIRKIRKAERYAGGL